MLPSAQSGILYRPRFHIAGWTMRRLVLWLGSRRRRDVLTFLGMGIAAIVGAKASEQVVAYVESLK